MKYLEASRLLREASFAERRTLLLMSSGQTENLDIYLRAEFAREGIDCRIEHIPFNTLQQQLRAVSADNDLRALLLLPWDFLPALDWRSGIVADEPDAEACLQQITGFAELLQRNGGVACYVDAPTPPLFTDRARQARMLRTLRRSALAACEHCLDGEAFGLAGYVDSGAPVNGRFCGEIARRLAASLLAPGPSPRRVLVTDLDGVAWAGVIGEDGADGIHCAAEGPGYAHHLYQGYLRKLQRAGILIAAVSKNDTDLATLPFRRGEMPLGIDDLVTVQASYFPKSVQIRRIAEALNLPLDAFVFVDDNPVELAEVGAALEDVAGLRFPADVADLPAFLERLGGYFDLRRVTADDRRRTALYRTRLAGMAPAAGDAAALDSFLRELRMRLRIHDRSDGDNERALQLFNKTNQFNLNGRRITREQLDRQLAAGGHLYTAAASDRHGEHGEVIACLLDASGAVELLVMSCRVLQRRIEHRFLCWIAARLPASADDLWLDYRPTERNTPFRLFLEQLGVDPRAGRLALPRARLRGECAALDDLFDLTAG